MWCCAVRSCAGQSQRNDETRRGRRRSRAHLPPVYSVPPSLLPCFVLVGPTSSHSAVVSQSVSQSACSEWLRRQQRRPCVTALNSQLFIGAFIIFKCVNHLVGPFIRRRCCCCRCCLPLSWIVKSNKATTTTDGLDRRCQLSHRLAPLCQHVEWRFRLRRQVTIHWHFVIRLSWRRRRRRRRDQTKIIITKSFKSFRSFDQRSIDFCRALNSFPPPPLRPPVSPQKSRSKWDMEFIHQCRRRHRRSKLENFKRSQVHWSSPTTCACVSSLSQSVESVESVSGKGKEGRGGGGASGRLWFPLRTGKSRGSFKMRCNSRRKRKSHRNDLSSLLEREEIFRMAASSSSFFAFCIYRRLHTRQSWSIILMIRPTPSKASRKKDFFF